MLGLDPLPRRPPISRPSSPARVDRPGFTVENLHFQSRPGLYVTGNLYLPEEASTSPRRRSSTSAATAPVKKGGVSYGNKVAYQHHGGLVRQQRLRLPGHRHAAARRDRGHPPRHLQREHVVVALARLHAGRRRGVELHPRARLPPDPPGSRRRPHRRHRPLAAAGPTAGGSRPSTTASRSPSRSPGITDLQNHVVDGCVEGHCDCMFLVNTYRWDYPTVAALVAPRPLLIANTDKDRIFPLDGVTRLYWKVARHLRPGQAGRPVPPAQGGPGPARSARAATSTAQSCRSRRSEWFNRYLKGEARTEADRPVGGEAGYSSRSNCGCSRTGCRRTRSTADPRDVRPDGAAADGARVGGGVGEAARRVDGGAAGQMLSGAGREDGGGPLDVKDVAGVLIHQPAARAVIAQADAGCDGQQPRTGVVLLTSGSRTDRRPEGAQHLRSRRAGRERGSAGRATRRSRRSSAGGSCCWARRWRGCRCGTSAGRSRRVRAMPGLKGVPIRASRRAAYGRRRALRVAV